MVIKYIKVKPIRVKVKKISLDPETLRRLKMENEKEAEVIEIREGLIKIIYFESSFFFLKFCLILRQDSISEF